MHQGISDFLKSSYALKSQLESDHYNALRDNVVKFFNKRWFLAEFQFKRLELDTKVLKRKYLECRAMVRNWFDHFYSFVQQEFEKCRDWNIAVVRAKPQSEISIRSDEHMLYVRIDEIDEGDKVIITDLKTGKWTKMTPAIRLQLGLCALAYKSKKGKMPYKVQAHFLASKDGIREIHVTDAFLKEAENRLDVHRMLTASTDINDYPCKCGKCESEFNGEGRDKEDTAAA